MRRRKPEPGAAAAADQRTVQTAAYALLAGRDFSRHELTERLLRKGYGAAVVEAAVAAIVQEGFLREERFAEQFVTQRAGRGQGPLRVRMGLRDRGVEPETIDQAFDSVLVVRCDLTSYVTYIAVRTNFSSEDYIRARPCR